MADFLQNAAASLSLLMPRRTVEYKQGGTSLSIQVTVGRSTVEWTDEDGYRMKGELRNYLIDRSELVVEDEEIKPQEGDTIFDDNNGDDTTYIVVGTAGMAWRWVSRYHKQYRVFVEERSEMGT